MNDSISEALAKLASHLKAGYPTTTADRAFILWYVDMRFGKSAQGVSKHLTDGPSDLGIDYCIKTPAGFVVLQSKYSAQGQLGKLAAEDVAAFQEVKRHLSGASSSDEFSQWKAGAGGVTKKALYQEIRSAALGGKPVRFVMITTKAHPPTLPKGIRIDARSEITYLWSLFEEGFSAPYPELVLNLKNCTWTPLSHGRLLTAQARIADILKAMHQHTADGIPPSRLFIQNVRSYLGTKPISKAIVRSYLSAPSTFVAKHNGIYLVASSVKKVNGKATWTLSYPSVVNGAQTLMALFTGVPESKFNSASVLVRALEAPEKQFRDQVIAATNSQNGMDPAALLAHHPALAEIALRLDAHGIFLERQQKSWHNEYQALLQQHRRVTVKQLVQWVSAAQSQTELGSIRSKVSLFVESKRAEKTLAPLVKSKHGTDANRLVVAVTMGLLARRVPTHLSGVVKGGTSTKVATQLKRDARIASILLAHLFSQAMGFTGTSMHKCSHALSNGLEKHAPVLLLIIVRQMVEQIRKDAASADLDISNYCKRDDLLQQTAGLLLSKGRKSALKKALLEWASGVD